MMELNQEIKAQPTRWIDAHCHLADPRYDGCLEEVIFRARRAGVNGWVQGGISPTDWDRQIQIRQKYGPGVILTFGLHPVWVAQQSIQIIEDALQELEKKSANAQGIGEIGLDFHPHRSSRASHLQQLVTFEKQLQIAKNGSKPLILHIVQAHPDALRVLRHHQPFLQGGLIHLFSGSLEIAQEYLKLGFLLSFGGNITRKGFRKLKRTLHSVPLDKIVVETDSPDQLPHLSGLDEGSLNEPANLPQIAHYLATLRGVNRDELLSQSTNNLKRLFGL